MGEVTDKISKPAATLMRKSSFFSKGGDEPAFFNASPRIQAKLSVSKPDDPQEKEADSVAEKVMTMPEPEKKEEPIQRQPQEEEKQVQRKEEEKEEKVQTKCDACAHEEKEKRVHPKAETFSSSYINRKATSLHHSDVIQCSGRGPPTGHIPFEQSLTGSKGLGSALPADTRHFMESRFGANFSGVRIHTGGYAEQMSSQVHAQAFTHGNDIYFNSGKFSPGTASGGLLLAHELTHTIQQGASTYTSSPAAASSPSSSPSVATKQLIHRSVEGAAAPQLGAAVEKAKSKEGKVNANKEGADGFREGWADLLDFFKTTFGPEQIISGRGNAQRGSVAEDDIKKKRTVDNMLIVDPVNTSGTTYGSRDAMPSWCGIFVFWALNKAGVPMPKWKLGENVVKPAAAYPPGYTPKPGDIAFRNTYSHYAIVSKVNGTTVSTVNGNTAGEDNLGGQVQERDHDISEWTGFFNSMVLKTGDLGTGEGGEERTRSLDELRERLFGVRRKAEHEHDPQELKENEQEEQEHKEIQPKHQLSDWSVDNKGKLQAAPPVQAKTEDQELQKKEDEKQEEPAQGIQQKELQFKTENNHTARPPPLVQLKGALGIQCSWLDRAWNAVSGFASEAASWVARGLDAAKEWLLRRVRSFVSNIPGYRLLSVILRRDPITGERVERSGMNILLAGLDILPLGFMFRGLMERLGILNDVANWVDGRIADLVSAASAIGDRFLQFWNRISLDDIGRPQEVMNDVADLLRYAIDQATGFMSRSASEFLEMVKRVMIREVSGFVRNRVPRLYPLLTVALGFDPETLQPVARNGTNILNALLEVSEEGREQRRQLTENGVLPRIAAWIDRGIAVFSAAYRQLMQAFHNLWGYVTVENLFHPIDTFTRIYEDFSQPVRLVGQFIMDAAREIIRVIKDVLLRRLRDYARTVRGYHLVTVIIGRDPFTGENIPRTIHNLVRGFMSLMDGGEEQYQQLQQSGAIDQTVARINAAVARLNMTPSYIIQLFTELWNSFSLRDLAHPIAAFQRIVARFGEPIGRLFAFVVEIVKIVVEVILRIMNFPFDLINNIINKAMQAFDLIKRDPVGFLKNLLRAIKQGFIQFFDNIGTHLLNGLTQWLMSELRDANVPTLTDLSLRGVIGWVLQVLGISMERIWEKLAQHPRIGPQRVARIRSMINTLEGIWTFIRDVQERGMAAIWDKIQEQLSNLWNTILDAVRNWIMEQIVNRMVTRLISMLDPTGIMAVINSAIALYSAIQSFIRYLREMLEIVNSFVEGTVEIAQGNPRRAANFLERTLARAVPIVIGFLANQVGLSGIGRRVGEMIARVREMVDQALTWLVDRAVNLGGRLLEMGRDAAGRVVDAVRGWLGFRVNFTTANGEAHSLYLQEQGSTVNFMMASTPVTFDIFIENKRREFANLPATDPKKQLLEQASAKNDIVKAQLQRLNQRDPGAGASSRAAAQAARQTQPTYQNTVWYIALVRTTNELMTILRSLVSGPQDYPPIRMPAFVNNSWAYRVKGEFIRQGQFTRFDRTNSNQHAGHLEGWEELQNANLTAGGDWVKMHLYTHKLGGLPTDSNLVPAPRSVNNPPMEAMERSVDTAVQGPDRMVVWYEVSVSYQNVVVPATGARRRYISGVTGRWGTYEFRNGRHEEVPHASAVPVSISGISPPAFTSTGLVTWNIHSMGEGNLSSVLGLALRRVRPLAQGLRSFERTGTRVGSTNELATQLAALTPSITLDTDVRNAIDAKTAATTGDKIVF